MAESHLVPQAAAIYAALEALLEKLKRMRPKRKSTGRRLSPQEFDSIFGPGWLLSNPALVERGVNLGDAGGTHTVGGDAAGIQGSNPDPNSGGGFGGGW